jgi:prepilin-type N-terminal cleavage/methylation domain-containing protein
MEINTKNQIVKGFTLLELLIVIGIIVILSVALILVLNPAETLKKSRDSQRISDLTTLKSAIGIYTTNTTAPKLDNVTNATCKTGTGAGTYGAGSKIYYSYPNTSPGAAITATVLDGGSGSVPASSQVTNANLSNTDGTGWLPINFNGLTGGSPISNLPTDPVNTVAAVGAPTITDFVYRYACNATGLTYELDVPLESTAYTVDDDRRIKDGGNNTNYYEVGTNLLILGTGTAF